MKKTGSVFDQMGFDKLDNFGEKANSQKQVTPTQEKINSGFNEILDQIGLERALLHFEKEEARHKPDNLVQKKKPVESELIATTETGEQMPFKVWCARWVGEAIDGHHLARAK